MFWALTIELAMLVTAGSSVVLPMGATGSDAGSVSGSGSGAGVGSKTVGCATSPVTRKPSRI